MGYTTDIRGIEHFWPDDTDDTIYSGDAVSLTDILRVANEKWSGCKLEDINISAEYIHTSCLYYDRYDPNDYTRFVVITHNKN